MLLPERQVSDLAFPFARLLHSVSRRMSSTAAFGAGFRAPEAGLRDPLHLNWRGAFGLLALREGKQHGGQIVVE
jgi:hypothetical protein